MNYFPAATNDPYETAVREMSREYGDAPFRKNVLRQEPEATSLKKPAAAKAKFADLARAFVERAKPAGTTSGVNVALKTRGIKKYKQGDYPAALADLQHAQRGGEGDNELLYHLASCKLKLGSPEGAREDFTLVLTRDHRHAAAWLGRARAHMELGSGQLANADLAQGERLDPQIAAAAKADLQRLSGTLAPAESPESLPRRLEQMFAAAQSGESLEKLRGMAIKLAKARHASRLRADESYQRSLAELRFAVEREPKNANRQAELGRFLYDNAPNLETLLAWTRLRLGQALLADNKPDEAAGHFQWVMQFEQRKPSVLDVGSMIRVPAKIANIQMVKVALAKNDRRAAAQLLQLVGRPNFLPEEDQAELRQLEMEVRTGKPATQPSGNPPQPNKPPGPAPVPQPNAARIAQLKQQIAALEETLRDPELDATSKKALQMRIERLKQQVAEMKAAR